MLESVTVSQGWHLLLLLCNTKEPWGGIADPMIGLPKWRSGTMQPRLRSADAPLSVALSAISQQAGGGCPQDSEHARKKPLGLAEQTSHATRDRDYQLQPGPH